MKYDIYGIGNALVDIVTEVKDEFLQQHDVVKGLMTLVDEERQFRLVEAINLKESNMQCGGSAANTVIAASQFGASCYYSCLVANDEMGHFYLKDLKANKVSTNMNSVQLPDGITGKCLVMTTKDAARTLNTYLGITSAFSKHQVHEPSLRQSHYLYMEGYLVASDTGREAMLFAKQIAEEAGIKTVLTFSDPSMVKFFKESMDEVIGERGVDLLFCNEEEALLFTGESELRLAREALKKKAKRFAITQGANGAVLYDGDTFIDIEPYAVEAVDTNGAGDMFAGAFLFGISRGHSFVEAGKIASLASSRVVSQYGPRLKTHQSQEILKHLFE